MAHLEVLILEFSAVDALATSACAMSEVSSLLLGEPHKPVIL